jgi:hypothetical protein
VFVKAFPDHAQHNVKSVRTLRTWGKARMEARQSEGYTCATGRDHSLEHRAQSGHLLAELPNQLGVGVLVHHRKRLDLLGSVGVTQRR